jgi:hypothetical protein
MSQLWNTAAGRAATREATNHVIRHRMSRHFPRNFVTEFDDWIDSGKTAFEFLQVIGQMNVGYDREILNLYELLNVLDGLEATTAAIDFFVNNDIGDDINGLGNETTPWATLDRAVDYLKDTWIDHPVRLFLAHTAPVGQTEYLSEQIFIAPKIRTGSLSIIGVGAAIETQTARTINAVTALGGAGDIVNQAGPAWGADVWLGQFLLGPHPTQPNNQAHAVHFNTAQDLYLHHATGLPAAADDITGVIPAIRIKIDNLSIEPTVASITSANREYSRIALVNLALDFTDSKSLNRIFSCSNADIYMDFVTLQFDRAGDDQFFSQRSSINIYEPIDTTLQVASESGIDNIGFGGNASPGISIFDTQLGFSPMVEQNDSELANATVTHGIYCTKGNHFLQDVAATQLECVRATNLHTKRAYVSSEPSINGYDLWQCMAKIDETYVGESTNCIEADGCNLEILDNCACDAASAVALACTGSVICKITGAMANFLGVVNVNFETVNPVVPLAWPAVNASIDDGMATTPFAVVSRL